MDYFIALTVYRIEYDVRTRPIIHFEDLVVDILRARKLTGDYKTVPTVTDPPSTLRDLVCEMIDTFKTHLTIHFFQTGL